MSTTEIGRRAEAAARVYLEMRGFTILEQNWRRPRAEIDVIARKENTVHFVEVKYRKNDQQGGGLEAVTASKLKQMRFAAEYWVAEEKYAGAYTLSTVEITGPEYAVISFIENVF